jgi:hypothetical protein
MNPLERLVLETLCVDCKPTDQLGYEWSLFRLDLGKDKAKMDSWVKQTKWAASTSTGTDKGNLVIKPMVLIPGREYFLRLNAWKSGGYPGGFVEYQFIVNVGPTGGSCIVNPLHGFALETDFKVQCDNWLDTDTPLQYMIGKLLDWIVVVDCCSGKTLASHQCGPGFNPRLRHCK